MRPSWGPRTAPSFRRVLAGCIVSLLALAGCSTGAGQGTPDSTGREDRGAASQLLAPDAFADATADPGRVVINVHVPFEGAIRDTDLGVPYDRIEQRTDRLPADRSTPLAIYCRTGRMSAIAAQTLADMGYSDIVELQGGMDAWVASGRDLVMTEPATSLAQAR